MIDSILQSELEKADNSFYASESLLEKIEEEDVSYRLGCRIYCENIKFDVPILNLSSSNKKTNMEILVESKSLTEIILKNIISIQIISGLNSLKEIDLENHNLSYKINHHGDDIYKVKLKLKEKRHQDGI